MPSNFVPSLQTPRKELARIVLGAWALHTLMAIILVVGGDYILSPWELFYETFYTTLFLTVFAATLISIPTTSFAVLAATRMALARMQLEAEASTDFLTKLPNRRGLQLYAERVLATSKTTGAFLLVDIDHFKSINDTYGHDTGDQVLRAIAQVLRTTVRDDTFVCRWGGEEFAAMVPISKHDAAKSLAERLRAAIAAHPFVVETSARRLTVTASIGVALFEGGSSTGLRTLYKSADQALYEAKSSGRNRVILAQTRAIPPSEAA